MDNINNNIEPEDKEYSLSELYYLLTKHRLKIVLSIIILFVLSIFYSLTVSPQYRSSSVIMLSQDGGSMSMIDMTFGKDRNFIENEIEVLKSLTISKLVIEKLINSSYRNDLYILQTNKTKTSFFGVLFESFNLYDNGMKEDFIVNDQFIRKAANKLRKSISVSNKRNTDIITE